MPKQCSVCKTRKESEAFSYCKKSPDLLRSECRQCQSDYNKKRRANKSDELNAKTCQWRREKREAYLRSSRKSYQSHAEKIKANARQRRKDNPTQVKAQKMPLHDHIIAINALKEASDGTVDRTNNDTDPHPDRVEDLRMGSAKTTRPAPLKLERIGEGNSVAHDRNADAIEAEFARVWAAIRQVEDAPAHTS